jgi:multimeric flavodoxin WrbA
MSEKILDAWQIALVSKKTQLETCQTEHQVSSCMQCTKLLDCEIRDDYIKAVYDSMSKGAGGGFEF